MRIAIDGRVFSVDQPGGDASVGIQLASEISEQHDVKVFSHADLGEWPRNKLKHSDLQKVGDYSSNMAYGLFWEQTFLAKAVRKWNPDVLYCPNSYCPIGRTKAKKVISIQDIPSYHSFGDKKYRLFRKAVLPVMGNRADRILTVSKFTKSEIVSQLGVSPEKVGVVYNGIDSVYFEEGSKPKETLPDSYILFVGAKSERKNIHGVIESYKILRQRYGINQKLVLVGPDQNPTYGVKGLEAGGDIGSNILNTGYLTDNELSYVYSNADVFAFPSYHESFGLPPVEAMASGTPVVTSRVGAIPEIVGDAAEFIDPKSSQDIAEGIYRVLTDDTHRGELIQRGTKTANKYKWTNSANQLMEEFDRT